MKGNSLNIEKYFMEDAADIEIDNKFKNDLKMRIMAQEKEAAAERPIRLKVAGWIAFAAFAGGTLFGAGGLYTHMVAKNSIVPSAIGSKIDNSKKTAFDDKQTENTPAKNTSEDDNTKTNSGTKHSVADKSSQNGTAVAVNKSPDKVTTPSKSDSNGKAAAAATAKPTPEKTAEDTKTAEEVNTISLTMRSGRYLIQSITVLKNESVSALPAELNSLTAEECAKLPADTNKGQVSESDGSIYMINHVNGKNVLVDTGTAPALYSKINILSYIKSDSEGKSSVWIFDGNSASKYNVLSDDSGKIAYLRTLWSSGGTELYVLAQDTDTKNYQLIKLTLDIK